MKYIYDHVLYEATSIFTALQNISISVDSHFAGWREKKKSGQSRQNVIDGIMTPSSQHF
jgi:hypothetical protein